MHTLNENHAASRSSISCNTRPWQGLQSLEARFLYSATLNGTGGEDTPTPNGHLHACGCGACCGNGLNPAEMLNKIRAGEDISNEVRYGFYQDTHWNDDNSPTVDQSQIIATPYALDQTFNLSSNPTATKTIYLDFNGHTTSGTMWNRNETGGNPFESKAFDLDGDLTTFSTAELTRIQLIWQQIAEDFAPFDVNVTTIETSIEDLTNSSSAVKDDRFGQRVIFGGKASDWATSGGGIGVAMGGSFRWDVWDTPCYVFTEAIGDDHSKTALVASHEIGHTLGLSHDGTTAGVGYYDGHGSGSNGWTSIMGHGHSKPLAQWSKGEYTDANNTEDDIATMMLFGEFGYRTDDHGNTNLNASLMYGTTTLTNQGLIERSTDVDVFAFTTGTGQVTINVDPYYLNPNLDVKASIYDSNGNLIISDGQNDGALNAQISTHLNAGTYYLHIEGTGDSNIPYSDYGSLGQYSINASVVDPGGDQVNPRAQVNVDDLTLAGYAKHHFSVSFDDNVSIDPSSLGNNNILITGPNGFSSFANLESYVISPTGTGLTAHYSVTAADGTWDHLENGTYTITLQANQVKDSSGNAVTGHTLGSYETTLYQRVGVNFIEDFESGTFAGHWQVGQSGENNTGRTLITTESDPYLGQHHLRMDTESSAFGQTSVNYAILHANLEGQTGMLLNFHWKHLNAQPRNFNSVDVSVDGGKTWHQVLELDIRNTDRDTWTEATYDLDALGLNYTRDTMIRFQGETSSDHTRDGIAYDQIQLLQVADAITQDVTGITINGGNYGDVLQVSAEGTEWVITLNHGTSRRFDRNLFSHLVFNGNLGNDQVTFTSTLNKDMTAQLSAQSDSLITISNDATFLIQNAFHLNFTGGNATNAVDLYDSTGDDTTEINAHTQIATMTGSGFSLTANDFDWIHSYANNGRNDSATVLTAGDQNHTDTLTTNNNLGTTHLTNGNYNVYTTGYDHVLTAASYGGTAVAQMHDSAGDDTYHVNLQGNNISMTGNGHRFEAFSFKQAHGYATSGGHDTAIFTDSYSNDLFTNDLPKKIASMRLADTNYSDYFWKANGFESVEAHSSYGDDIATFIDRPIHALAVDGGGMEVDAMGANEENYVVGFQSVHSLATTNTDQRFLTEAPADQTRKPLNELPNTIDSGPAPIHEHVISYRFAYEADLFTSTQMNTEAWQYFQEGPSDIDPLLKDDEFSWLLAMPLKAT